MTAPRFGHKVAGTAVSGALVAREGELSAVRRLVGNDVATSALILQGEPGIGKTTLWESGVTLGREQGLRVLVARASDAETGLPFAALIDLFDNIGDEELAALPPPQQRALKVALYRADPSGPSGPSEPHVISLSVLSALRALSTRERLLVAIDDIQWLDRASEESLAYAIRRLDHEPIGFLCARRPGRESVLHNAFPAGRAELLRVEPLSLGATRQLLAERLGLRLTHHTLRRVYDATVGNPLFALEIGRLLAGRDVPTWDEDIPVPEDVEHLLGMRVADLDSSVRTTLLALALDADVSRNEVDALAGEGTVRIAVDEGVVVTDGDRVRAAHPLLAAAAKRQAGPKERRELHRLLASVVPDEQRRVLHLALATPTQDESLAVRVAAAAEVAAPRGATLMAVELATHAMRLTPAGSATYVSHLLQLGEHLRVAGEKQRLTELLSGTVESLPHGAPRVAGYLLLTNGVVRNNDDIRGLMERALAEAGDDDELRAPVLAELAENQAVIEVADIDGAEERAAEALACSGSARPDHRRTALYTLSWVRALGGHPIDALAEEYRTVSDERFFLARSPERVAGQRHVWRGEIRQARELLTSLQVLAEERAEPTSYALQRLHLCELMLRIGDWDHAERLLDEWGDSTDSELLHWPMYERCRALLQAGRGDTDAARRWGADALARAEATGVRWDWLESKRALGLAALLDRDVQGCVQELRAVWDYTRHEGVMDPGAFPVAPDLVEALVEAGSLDEARLVADQLADRARNQDHAWASVGARRCQALVELGDGTRDYSDRAATALAEAAAAYEVLGLRFDHARTVLSLGRAQRRAKKWAAARTNLELAATAFEAMASPGWAWHARSELARVATGRSPSSTRLTPTERRVAELAVDGLSNKEIARTLVVTVNTVEFHLRNTYAKLGVRSRVQLAGQLDEQLAEEPSDPRP